MDLVPKKSLGQHWLDDVATLETIADAGQLKPDDTVLEIGPGLGTLTRTLVKKAKRVIAVEVDQALADQLPERVVADNLTVVHADILRYDLTQLPAGYVVIANIPYYLTSNLIRVLSESINPPRRAVLLVQQEVAERVNAAPGEMSLLSITAQWYWQVALGPVVPAKLFTPPPKVNSQVLILERRATPPFDGVDVKVFFRIVKAGFSQRRKTLHNSLSAGLQLSKDEVEIILNKASIMPKARPQELSLADWHKLYINLTS